MDDYQLNSIVSSEIRDSLNHFDSEYSQERIRALDFYLGEPLGNEVEGRSQVVDTTVGYSGIHHPELDACVYSK